MQISAAILCFLNESPGFTRKSILKPWELIFRNTFFYFTWTLASDPRQINSIQLVLGIFTCKMKLPSSNFSKSMHLGLRQIIINQLLTTVLVSGKGSPNNENQVLTQY